MSKKKKKQKKKKAFWKSWIKPLIIGLSVLVVELALMLFFSMSEQNTNDLLGHILSFSSIVVAVLITYIFSKIFQIRNERLELKKEIIDLSNKVTHFRRVCRLIKYAHSSWKSGIKVNIKKHVKLDFFIAHDLSLDDDSKEYKIRQKYWDDPKAYTSGADLYLAVDCFALDEGVYSTELWNEYDHDYVYRIPIIEKWVESNAANQIWYWFDHKYRRLGDDFEIDKMLSFEKDQVTELARKINPEKYNRYEFDRYLIAELGTDFDSFYLPRLLKKSKELNVGIPFTLKYLSLFNTTLLILGVLAPVVLLSLNFNPSIKLWITYSIVMLFSAGIAIFMFQFHKILEKEIQVLNSK